ncbi:MAG: DUF1697 domain-containing protein [Deltaproteobacteria bacterium]|nr:DUF1697 domain-containing protein [Deltaproteobacteria bacterium]
MPTYIALLRGINVSGHKQIRMAELKKSAEALGFGEVRTYLQSGNLLFSALRGDPLRHAKALSARIASDFEHEVAVLVLSAAKLDQIAGAHPLWPEQGGDAKLFHATFLFEPVSESVFKALSLPAGPGEAAVLSDQTIFLHCPHGYGRTKLNNSYFERALKVPATTRNWRTVLALNELAGGP